MKYIQSLLIISSLLSGLQDGGQTIYKHREKDPQDLSDRWTIIATAQLEEYRALKDSAVYIGSDTTTLKTVLVQIKSTWEFDGKLYIETRLFDPVQVVAQKGYNPVDMVFIEIRDAEIDTGDPE